MGKKNPKRIKEKLKRERQRKKPPPPSWIKENIHFIIGMGISTSIVLLFIVCIAIPQPTPPRWEKNTVIHRVEVKGNKRNFAVSFTLERGNDISSNRFLISSEGACQLTFPRIDTPRKLNSEPILIEEPFNIFKFYSEGIRFIEVIILVDIQADIEPGNFVVIWECNRV